MNVINWHRKALKQLRKIGNPKIRARIYDAVDTLKFFPNCQNVKKLVNRTDYRLRVENYRVLFTAELKIIEIQEVKKRDERTY